MFQKLIFSEKSALFTVPLVCLLFAKLTVDKNAVKQIAEKLAR